MDILKYDRACMLLDELVRASKELAFKGSYNPITWQDIDDDFNSAYQTLLNALTKED